MKVNLSKAIAGLVFVLLGSEIYAANSDTVHEPNTEGKQVHYAVSLRSHEVAARDGIILTSAELGAFLSTMPEERRGPFLADPERFTKVLRNQLDIKHMAQDAIAAGLDKEAQIQARLANALWRELAEIFQENYLAEREFKDYSSRAEELYLGDPERYRRPQRLTFSHVLLATKEHTDPLARRALAERLAAELQGDASFSETALEHSNDSSVTVNNGTISNVSVDRLDPEFRKQVDQLETGETDIVESSYGTHVVRVDARKDPGIAPFEEVKNELVERARQQHRNQLLEQYQKDFYEHPLHMPENAARRFLQRYEVTWD